MHCPEPLLKTTPTGRPERVKKNYDPNEMERLERDVNNRAFKFMHTVSDRLWWRNWFNSYQGVVNLCCDFSRIY